MKRFVNGLEVERDTSHLEVSEGLDRLLVRSPEDGLRTGLAIKQGDTVLVSYGGNQYTVQTKLSRTRVGAVGSGEITAPMPGQVVDVFFAVGDSVKKGDKLFILEAMKTQQPFMAPFDGKVTQMNAEKGQQVADGALLAMIEKAEA